MRNGAIRAEPATETLTDHVALSTAIWPASSRTDSAHAPARRSPHLMPGSTAAFLSYCQNPRPPIWRVLKSRCTC